ncbi:MAG: hypothetical protein QXD48_01215 [Candidatus Aenigmatarchaeota archaeon]
MIKKYILLIVILILVSGCIQQKEIKEIMIPGHGNQVYTFENDIREALKVKTNNESGIKEIFLRNDHFNIVFDGSNQQDNAYFRVVLINMAKIPIYFAYDGRIITFDYYYYIGEQWFNSTDGKITKPELKYPSIWFLGPNTGANETSVNLIDNVIYLQGTSYKNLTLAGDKLTLIVFGIEKIDNLIY